jgi:hypothetical protein
MIEQRNNVAANPAEVFIPTPVSVQSGQALHGEQASDSNEDFQPQSIGTWPEIDASYFQIDWPFHNLFECGMPNVFRDHAAWESLHTAIDEETLGGQ